MYREAFASSGNVEHEEVLNRKGGATLSMRGYDNTHLSNKASKVHLG
jgi:hypothetical protein